MTKSDKFVYSYVPKESIQCVMDNGLYGGKALLSNKNLLKQVASFRGMSLNSFQDKIKESLKDEFFRPSKLGPNIVFQLIPNLKKMSKKHPVVKNNLVPIKINLSKLLKDLPDTKIFGMELKPNKKDVSVKDRAHYLSDNELKHLLSKSPNDLWSLYNDLDDKGLYAPDVPHASIHTKDGIIPKEYLEEIKENQEIDNLEKLASEYEKLCFKTNV